MKTNLSFRRKYLMLFLARIKTFHRIKQGINLNRKVVKMKVEGKIEPAAKSVNVLSRKINHILQFS